MSEREFSLFMLVPSVGGPFGEQVELLVSHLRGQNVRVFLAVPSRYHEEGRPRHADDWAFSSAGGLAGRAIRLFSPVTLWSLARRLFRLKPDCVYVYGGEAYPPTVLTLILCRVFGLRCVLSVHDVVPHPGKFFDFAYGKIRVPFLRLPSLLHTFSEHGREILARRFPKQSVVWSPLLDLAEIYLRYPAAAPQVEKCILCFGRVEPYKDIPCVVEAFAKLRRSRADATLRIVGKNGLGHRLFELTEGVAGCEVVDRFLPPRALAEELSQAHACILAYTEASHSGSAELALAFGCNVVATKVAAFSAMAGEPGVFLFEPGDAGDCAARLLEAVTMPKRARDPRRVLRLEASNRARTREFMDGIGLSGVRTPA